MDIISHALVGKILSSEQKSKKNIFWIIFFSVLPDLFLIPLFFVLGSEKGRFFSIPKNVDWFGAEISHKFLYSFYDLSHSIIIALIIILPVILLLKLPKLAFVAYLLHILLDLPTHTGEWTIKIFYPLSNYSINGFTDAWEWPLKYMAISWLVLTGIIVFIHYIKKHSLNYKIQITNAKPNNSDRTNT